MLTMLTTVFGPLQAVENFFSTHGDKRVSKLTFMDSPWEVTLIALFYTYFCYDLGPHRLMKNRQAFDLVWVVRIFNSLLLLLNVWLLSRLLSLLNWGYDSIGCAVSTNEDKHQRGPKVTQSCLTLTPPPTPHRLSTRTTRAPKLWSTSTFVTYFCTREFWN